jgi:hypothetical protein
MAKAYIRIFRKNFHIFLIIRIACLWFNAGSLDFSGPTAMLNKPIRKMSYHIALQRLPALLSDAGFRGDTAADAALLAAKSTDNSI